MKNGFTFISIVSSDNYQSGIWDPYKYKNLDNNDLLSLGEFVNIKKVNGRKIDAKHSDFLPIEYKHIPKGDLLTFNLEETLSTSKGKYSYVNEHTLLFGTMRAYLGNACITPLGKWIEKSANTKYLTNSEFVKISPHDKCNYFWWAYMKSIDFLRNMPTGSGGTRPRVSAELIADIRVIVPPIDERLKINKKLETLAEVSWGNYFQGKNIMKTINEKYAN